MNEEQKQLLRDLCDLIELLMAQLALAVRTKDKEQRMAELLAGIRARLEP